MFRCLPCQEQLHEACSRGPCGCECRKASSSPRTVLTVERKGAAVLLDGSGLSHAARPGILPGATGVAVAHRPAT